MLRPGEGAGTLLCVMCRQPSQQSPWGLDFSQEIQTAWAGALPSDRWPSPITSFRYQLVQGLAAIVHTAHTGAHLKACAHA